MQCITQERMSIECIIPVTNHYSISGNFGKHQIWWNSSHLEGDLNAQHHRRTWCVEFKLVVFKLGDLRKIHQKPHQSFLLYTMYTCTCTYSLFKCAVALCHLDGVDVAPRTVHTKHLTVDQSDQVLTHLTLHNTMKWKLTQIRHQKKLYCIHTTLYVHVYVHVHVHAERILLNFHLVVLKWTATL